MSLPGMMGGMPLAPREHQSFIDSVRQAGLTSSLLITIDVADTNCYSGGQNILDLSGGGRHFFNGGDATGTNDMTFSGSVGSLAKTSYMEKTATSSFIESQSTLDSSMQNLPAGGSNFTIVEWYWAPTGLVYGTDGTGTFESASVAATPNYVGTSISTSQHSKGLTVFAGATLAAFAAPPSVPIVEGAWNYFGGAMAIGASNGSSSPWKCNNNGSATSGTATNAAAPAASASTERSLFSPNSDKNGSRLSCFAVWNRALSAAELQSLYEISSPRFQ